MTYSYWDDICTDVKLTIPTWAFSSTTLSQTLASGTGTTYADLTIADTDLDGTDST